MLPVNKINCSMDLPFIVAGGLWLVYCLDEIIALVQRANNNEAGLRHDARRATPGPSTPSHSELGPPQPCLASSSRVSYPRVTCIVVLLFLVSVCLSVVTTQSIVCSVIPGLTDDHHCSFRAAPPLQALSAYHNIRATIHTASLASAGRNYIWYRTIL